MPAAVGAPTGGTASPLKTGLSFYRGRTITYIVPTAAGAQYDAETRAIVPLMESYLHATINVENISAGQSIPGQDMLASSSPDGLTIGMFETGTDLSNVIQDLPGLNFNPEREVFLGGPESSTSLLVTAPGSPFTSFAALVQHAATTPAKILLQSSSSAAMKAKLFLRAFGVPVDVIYGYANSTAIVAGFVRGDGNVMYQSVEAAAPLVQAGKAYAVAQDVKPPKSESFYSVLAQVPTPNELAKRFPATSAGEKRARAAYLAYNSLSTICIGGPAGIPPARVVALRAAIKYALESRQVENEYLEEGNPVGYVDGPTEKLGYIEGLKLVKTVQQALGI